jgi:hypothetical protein
VENVLGLCAEPGVPVRRAPVRERVQALGMH